MGTEDYTNQFTLIQQLILNRAGIMSYEKGDEWYLNFLDRFLSAYDNDDNEQFKELEREVFIFSE